MEQYPSFSEFAWLSELITGAAAIPDAVLIESVSKSLELKRDIYVYGSSDRQSLEAALRLRAAGYQSAADLKRGLPKSRLVLRL